MCRREVAVEHKLWAMARCEDGLAELRAAEAEARWMDMAEAEVVAAEEDLKTAQAAAVEWREVVKVALRRMAEEGREADREVAWQREEELEEARGRLAAAEEDLEWWRRRAEVARGDLEEVAADLEWSKRSAAEAEADVDWWKRRAEVLARAVGLQRRMRAPEEEDAEAEER